ncbi:helix-turn-helix domain-containing protein [Trinickia soli]|uniref:helix-turn-helix domain-containing protein n=1 Tax=Trinickia soli TaxID=380675 RepID=UPI00135C51C3
MSHKVSELVWKRFDQSGSTKLVMLHLADHCDDTGGKLYPSIQTVARDCGMSVKQARRIVHALIKAGYLEVVSQVPGKVRHYRLRIDRLTLHAPAPADGCPTPPVNGSGFDSASPPPRGSAPSRQREIAPPINGSRILFESSLTTTDSVELDRQAASPSEQRVVSIPLVDGSEYPVGANQIAEWSATYPGIDVLEQLRRMRQWSIANPARRKTVRGVLRFANNWLAREQDKPRRSVRADDDLALKGGI